MSIADHAKSAVPPIGASVAGWPWWAVAALFVASCGASWAMGWLDVRDRLRPRRGSGDVITLAEDPSQLDDREAA
jgi:hypothetical protein